MDNLLLFDAGTYWLPSGSLPRNMIEEGVYFLLNSPAVASKLPRNFVGCEWWVQYRTHGDGMGLHLDADVGMFESVKTPDGNM